MSCRNSRHDEVFVLISHTGRAKNMIELARLTCVNVFTGLAMSSAKSSLADVAMLALTLDVSENTAIYLPMIFRLAQLTLVDIRVTVFTPERGAPFRDKLKRVKNDSTGHIMKSVMPERDAQKKKLTSHSQCESNHSPTFI